MGCPLKVSSRPGPPITAITPALLETVRAMRWTRRYVGFCPAVRARTFNLALAMKAFVAEAVVITRTNPAILTDA